MIITLSKAIALVFYALVAASFVVALPVSPEVLHWARMGVAVLFGIHALELLAMRKVVARYPGPFAVSAGLTLLFGILHWKPLANRPARG
jgi:uncharacterized protein YhhL (DUF1145 family)